MIHEHCQIMSTSKRTNVFHSHRKMTRDFYLAGAFRGVKHNRVELLFFWELQQTKEYHHEARKLFRYEKRAALLLGKVETELGLDSVSISRGYGRDYTLAGNGGALRRREKSENQRSSLDKYPFVSQSIAINLMF